MKRENLYHDIVIINGCSHLRIRHTFVMVEKLVTGANRRVHLQINVP